MWNYKDLERPFNTTDHSSHMKESFIQKVKDVALQPSLLPNNLFTELHSIKISWKIYLCRDGYGRKYIRCQHILFERL